MGDSYHQVKMALEKVQTAIQFVEVYIRRKYKADILDDLDDAETALVKALVKLENCDED